MRPSGWLVTIRGMWDSLTLVVFVSFNKINGLDPVKSVRCSVIVSAARMHFEIIAHNLPTLAQIFC